MSQGSAARVDARRLGVLAVIAVLGALALHVGGARADGPGAGVPWVTTVGDSYISGEAGRWAGNSNQGSSWIDALGPTAYDDAGSGEAIAGCHRSRSAEVYLGGGVNGQNFACSGAKTATSDGSSFKPGLDFYANGSKQGQALALQGFVASHNVKMIGLSIGGNNFNFASIVQSCVQDWLLSPSWWKDYCNDDSSVTANFTAANIAAQTAAIKQSILNVRQAMANAGYADSAYTILVQDYESPLPRGSAIRYGESGYTRQNTGGCGFWNNDANWANDYALPTINNAVKNAASQTGLSNVRILELQSAFNGRRLCENTVGLLEEKGLTSWTQAGAADRTEWINQIRTVSTVFGPYQVQESLHPNYWGQLALRNCVRQAYNGGAPRGGTCTIAGTGLTSRGEPNMSLL